MLKANPGRCSWTSAREKKVHGTDVALVRPGRRRETDRRVAGGGHRHRYSPASHPLWDGLVRERDRAPQGVDHGRSGDAPALERGGEPANSRTDQARRAWPGRALRELSPVTP